MCWLLRKEGGNVYGGRIGAMANKRTAEGPGKGGSREVVQQGRCPLIRREEDATHILL
jgi:hypothetical protein